MCVLFVDDEPLIKMVIEDALKDAGHEVMTAPHVPAAVELLRRHPGKFIAVVSDYHMPGELNGVDLIEHVRESYPAMPAVMATGRPDIIKTEWLAHNSVELLEKPYTPEMLVSLVDRLLHRAGWRHHRCIGP
jgi:DNA-binding NtrC family response regulator